jgi:hypothetical protein
MPKISLQKIANILTSAPYLLGHLHPYLVGRRQHRHRQHNSGTCGWGCCSSQAVRYAEHARRGRGRAQLDGEKRAHSLGGVGALAGGGAWAARSPRGVLTWGGAEEANCSFRQWDLVNKTRNGDLCGQRRLRIEPMTYFLRVIVGWSESFCC